MVAMTHGLEKDWLNDAVKMFVSEKPEYQLFGEYPKDNPGLRVFVASPEYIFAMKCFAMRSSLESSDMTDIWHLSNSCDIKTMGRATEVIDKFFPGQALPADKKEMLESFFFDPNDVETDRARM